MKKMMLLTVLVVTLCSCSDDNRLSFTIFNETDPPCEACARVELSYPLTSGNSRIERKINTIMNQWVRDVIDLSPDLPSPGVAEAAASFREAHMAIKNEWPDEYHTNWETTVDGQICYEDELLFAVCMQTYSFTGGAHGYGSSHYLIFNKKTGDTLSHPELLTDSEALEKLAESKFREQYNLSESHPLSAMGFMFEGDNFHLPQNIGYTDQGLRLIYNPYEVAPFSEGQIVIDIPFEQVNNLLRFKGRSKS